MNCSETVYFTVDLHSNSSPYSTNHTPAASGATPVQVSTGIIVIAAVSVAIAVVALAVVAGLLVYHKRRSQNSLVKKV